MCVLHFKELEEYVAGMNIAGLCKIMRVAVYFRGANRVQYILPCGPLSTKAHLALKP